MEKPKLDPETGDPFKIPPVRVEFVNWLPWFYAIMGAFLLMLLLSKRG